MIALYVVSFSFLCAKFNSLNKYEPRSTYVSSHYQYDMSTDLCWNKINETYITYIHTSPRIIYCKSYIDCFRRKIINIILFIFKTQSSQPLSSCFSRLTKKYSYSLKWILNPLVLVWTFLNIIQISLDIVS